MRCLITLLLLTVVSGDLSALGRQNGQRGEKEFFVEPRESILSVVASQPKCPLVFETLEFLHYIDGGGLQNYVVRNRSGKPIARFTIATLGMGGGGSLDDIKPEGNQWLLPGQSWPRAKDSARSLVQLTSELQKQYKVGPPMKAIVVYIVVRVEFADGSVYSDEPVYKELKALFEDTVPVRR